MFIYKLNNWSPTIIVLQTSYFCPTRSSNCKINKLQIKWMHCCLVKTHKLSKIQTLVLFCNDWNSSWPGNAVQQTCALHRSYQLAFNHPSCQIHVPIFLAFVLMLISFLKLNLPIRFLLASRHRLQVKVIFKNANIN